MTNPTVIHPLAQKGKPSGKITFIHSDGLQHSYTSVVNRLSGSRLSYFDSNLPTIDNSLKEVRAVFRNIRKKAKVLENIGDF